MSIGIERVQTAQLIFPQYLILLCHVCYIRRFQLFETVQQCVMFCEVLGSGVMDNKSILSTLYIVRRTISVKYSVEVLKYSTQNIGSMKTK